MTTLSCQQDGRIALNRPDVMNAIDDRIAWDPAGTVAWVDSDTGVHVMVLSGVGEAFCAGHDLTFYAEGNGSGEAAQSMLFARGEITGREAADMGLALKAAPADQPDDAVAELAARMAMVPVNQPPGRKW